MIEQALCPVLIGREAELAALEAALLEARRGSGGLALLAGEAGLGKSCTVRLSRGAGREPGWSSREVHGGGRPPYLPFIEALGNHVAAVGAPKAGAGGPAASTRRAVPELGVRGRSASSDAPQSAALFSYPCSAAAGDRGLL
jgi:hypothetical protein